MRKTRRTWIGLYGNTALVRCVCPACCGTAFVEHGKSACCDAPVTDPTHYKRESEPEQRRRLPSWADRDACLEHQGHRCLYCDRRFGHFIVEETRLVQLRVEWDHFVPYSFNQDNHGRNFVAACQICNRIKRDRIFGSVEEVRAFVAAQTQGSRDETLS